MKLSRTWRRHRSYLFYFRGILLALLIISAVIPIFSTRALEFPQRIQAQLSSTPTITQTATATQNQASPGPTQPSPTNESYPGPIETLTPPLYATSTETGNTSEMTPQPSQIAPAGGATATLIPFPTITIEFPQVKRGSNIPLPDTSIFDNNFPSLKSLLGLWPLGLIILAWIGLGAWFYLSHRHFH